MKKDIYDIVNDANMSSRPGFYSGRGAMLCDLNPRQLEKIWKEININYSEDAGNNFIQMVADIPVLSATDFLVSLYKLANNDFKWENYFTQNEQGQGIAFENYGEAVGTIFSIFGGMSSRDETQSIKIPFLTNHNYKFKNADRYKYNDGNLYFIYEEF